MRASRRVCQSAETTHELAVKWRTHPGPTHPCQASFFYSCYFNIHSLLKMPFLGLATKGDTDALKSMIGQVNALAQTLDHSTKQLNDMSEKSISDFLPEGMAILPKVEEGMTCLQFDRWDGKFAMCIPSSADVLNDGVTPVQPKGKCISMSGGTESYCLIKDDPSAFYDHMNKLIDEQKEHCWKGISDSLPGIDIPTDASIATRCLAVYETDEASNGPFKECCSMLGTELLRRGQPVGQ